MNILELREQNVTEAKLRSRFSCLNSNLNQPNSIQKGLN